MKSVPLATLVLGSVLVSIATVYSTDLPARDKSSRGASVSAGNTTASADRGGASARAGNSTASAERALTASAERAGARAGAGNTTASVERGDADVESDGGREARAVPAASGKPVGDRSWFDDLRSMFSGNRKDADIV
ncbi:MAG: hypothetical protein K0R41_2371 [Geminicoccaceae bacterium]|nr:hypothetical protein [Geminicoccaceae bacterium]